MNRLWIRLSLAFSAVVLIAAAILIIAPSLLSEAGVLQFFLTGHFRAPGGLTDDLAAYYAQHQTWDGVEEFLNAAENIPRDIPLLLADSEGHVIYSTGRGQPPDRLSGPQQRDAIAIVVDERVVGYLSFLLPPAERRIVEDNSNFLLQLVSRGLILIALVGGVLGIIFGVAVSRSFTAPLSRLAEAAKDIGAQKFSRRVGVKGSVEITAVARAFNEMAEALEEAERLRRNLVADVAHELRTPLAVLQGNLRALLDDVYPLNKAEIAQLYEETRLLSRLVSDLHELSQAEARQLPLDLQPVNLSLLVDDVVTSFGVVAESQGVTLHVEVAPDLPTVQADSARLTQVLHNLLSNALHHTPGGGTISLRAEADSASIRLSVHDTGDGIPAEHLAHVFDRFYRVERDRSRDTGGAGLGLAIVRAIVEAHGGHVTVTSEGISGLGTTFTIHLPLPA
ncbi:MAG: ATP-binding protein [Anaerolineae bacterium]